MPILVRTAEIEKERVSLTAFLSRYLSPDATDARYEWLYSRNPKGLARAWVAYDSEVQEIVGMAAAFPRLFYSSGSEALGYVLGDFCIDPRHRTLGPALALQRACMESLLEGDADFVYDFPSQSMVAVYRRLRVEPQEQTIRFAKPLRANRRIAAKMQIAAAAEGIAAIANAGLRVRDRGLRVSGNWVLHLETGRCSEEFTEAALEWSPKIGICAARTADYLNWRYREHPQRRYEMLTARQSGKLCGYLVFHRDGENYVIDDLLGESDAPRRDLLVQTVSVARADGAQTLSAPWLSKHPGRQLLEDCGFKPRESSPVVLMGSIQAARYSGNAATPLWYLTDGDRES